MKYCHSFLFSIFLLMASTVAPAQSRSQVESLSKSIEADLVESILPFWSKYTVDPDGGFYGTVMNDGRAVASDKGAILNARILWTCSRAYRIYGIPEYKEMADRAADYFKQLFSTENTAGCYGRSMPRER